MPHQSLAAWLNEPHGTPISHPLQVTITKAWPRKSGTSKQGRDWHFDGYEGTDGASVGPFTVWNNPERLEVGELVEIQARPDKRGGGLVGAKVNHRESNGKTYIDIAVDHDCFQRLSPGSGGGSGPASSVSAPGPPAPLPGGLTWDQWWAMAADAVARAGKILPIPDKITDEYLGAVVKIVQMAVIAVARKEAGQPPSIQSIDDDLPF